MLLHPENAEINYKVGKRFNTNNKIFVGLMNFYYGNNDNFNDKTDDMKNDIIKKAINIISNWINNDLSIKSNNLIINDDLLINLVKQLKVKSNFEQGSKRIEEIQTEINTLVNKFNLNDKEGIHNLLWNGSRPIFQIKPDLTTDETCQKRSEEIMIETCDEALVKQGIMINNTLADFSKDIGRSSSKNLFPKYLPKADNMIYQDYAEKYMKISNSQQDGKFGDIITNMFKINNAFNNSEPDDEINDFFNKISIYIILVINITPIDFGGVEPNNPPQPPYIALEKLKEAVFNIKNNNKYHEFIKNLAFTLEIGRAHV